MIPEPRFRLFHCGRLSSNDTPESCRVIRFNQVGKFMNDNVINNKHGGFD